MLILICLASFAASLLTLISGFGLGTLLLPVFSLFFPLEVAVALTAVVHLLNNIFKAGLLKHDVHWRTVLWFGLPGIIGAYAGARLMLLLGERDPLFQGVSHPVDPLDLVIAGLMVVFGILEISRKLSTVSLPSKWMLPGGLLSGFFGGLSGHQGALRSLFLLRTALDKEAFIATGVIIALLVDLTRLPLYMSNEMLHVVQVQGPLLLACMLSAFLGAWGGRTLIPKVTLRGVQVMVGLLLLGIAIMLGAGII